MNIFPLYPDRSVVLGIDSRENFYKCRFAGTVLAHECVDLTFIEREVNVLQSTYAGKRFIYIPHLKNSVVFHVPYLFVFFKNTVRKVRLDIPHRVPVK